MTLPALLVEAFTEQPCQGNGAAVVLLKEALPAAQLQAIARSLQQSETAFLLRQQDAWLLRWFTPTCEVPLCGHGTLAALLALGHWGHLLPGAAAALHSRSGPLRVELDGDNPALGRLDLPSSPMEPAQPPASLMALLARQGVSAPLHYWTSPLGYRVALVGATAPLQALVIPASELPEAEQGGLVIMQALEGAPVPQVLGIPADYQLRFFAPGLGIPEDPVTGSAHALVAPYWLERLGRRSVAGWQCSDRPGGVHCEAASSGMIRLSGAGHLLWNGSLNLSGWTAAPSDAVAADCDPGWGALLPRA